MIDAEKWEKEYKEEVVKSGGKGVEKDLKSINVYAFIDELYEALCLKLKGRALGMMKNLMDNEDVCGMVVWYKLSYDVQGFFRSSYTRIV